VEDCCVLTLGSSGGLLCADVRQQWRIVVC
jgi:hypothetical protein